MKTERISSSQTKKYKTKRGACASIKPHGIVRFNRSAHTKKRKVGVIMKRFFAVMLLVSLFVGLNTFAGYAAKENKLTYKTVKTNGKYVTRFYSKGKLAGKVVTSKKLKVKVVKSEKLTAKQLETRKNKYILVAVIKGKCISSNGDGIATDGYYINYSGIKGCKRGAKFTTYCVYGNNNYIDDIVIRADIKRK